MDERTTGWGSLVSAEIFVEGGGESNFLKSRCRDGFRLLLEKSGFAGRMPKIHPSGDGAAALRRFRKAVSDGRRSDYVGVLIDSEDPVDNINEPWDHLSKRQGSIWQRPDDACDDQVLFMTTCMETWIAADREALREAYARRGINENALPPLDALESRNPQDVFNRLKNGTNNQFDKGEESFKILGQLNPDTLAELLPSFERARRILNEKLSR